MDRVPAALNQRQNSIQSTLASRNSESRARFKTKLSQANNVSEIEAAKAFVVGDIHEDSIWAN